MESLGSEPRERKQMNGVLFLDSLNIFSISRITPSAYTFPILSATKFLAWNSTLSGHQDLTSTVDFREHG